MSAFTLHVITAVAFGLAAPVAAFNAFDHWAFRELSRAAAWSALAITYAVLAAAYAIQAAGG